MLSHKKQLIRDTLNFPLLGKPILDEKENNTKNNNDNDDDEDKEEMEGDSLISIVKRALKVNPSNCLSNYNNSNALATMSSNGSTRVQVNDNSILKDVMVALKSKGVEIDGTYLSKNPRGHPIEIGTTLSNLGIKTGDMLYLVSQQDINPNKTTTTTTTSTTSSTSTITNHFSNNNNNNNSLEEEYKSRLTPSCKHSIDDKCVFCTEAEGIKRCNHPENTTCPNCQNKKFQGKKLKWLCNHPPGGKCSNCLRVPKNVEYKCNHGPSAVCTNCMGKKNKSSEEENNNNNNNSKTAAFSPKTNVKEEIVKLKCLHGPNARCTNCLPKDDPNEVKPPTRKCKNHGPHGSCVECIEWRESLKMKLKSQDAPKCPGALVDFQSANAFQQYLHLKKFQEQRVGFLYGNFLEDGTVVVDAIYEPPQKSDKKQVQILDDEIHRKQNDKVESLANLLGKVRVGWIFSHPSRKYIMSSSEIIQAAHFQNKYSPSFITLILSINNEGQSNLEAFQVSDQALKLEKTGEFSNNQPEPSKCKLKSPVFEEGSETINADNNFFIVTVPVKAREDKSIFNVGFPVENREPSTHFSDFISYKIDNQDHSPLTFFSDFHFLIFLIENNIFDLNVDLPVICENIKNRSSDNLSFYFEIIEGQVQQLLKDQ
eukprot:gene5334-6654_t